MTTSPSKWRTHDSGGDEVTREERTEYMRRYRVEKRDKQLAYYRERRRRKAAERGPITATCAGCGKTFVKTGHHQRFCSAACRRRRAGVTVVCKMCGKTFTARTVRAQFCSRSCNRAYFYRKSASAKPVVSKTCPVCGKTFETRNPRKVYCTKKCQTTAYHKARRKPAQTHVCVFCGKHFTAQTSRARFCSTLCAGRVRLGYATLADFERARAQRKAAYNKQRERDRNGLTLAQIQAVIDAQSGDPSRLWKLSQSWTAAQRKYAKKRYEEMHGLFSGAFLH